MRPLLSLAALLLLTACGTEPGNEPVDLQRQHSAHEPWSLVEQIDYPGSETRAGFGTELAFAGDDTLVVGSPQDSVDVVNGGAIYAYDAQGSSWQSTADILTATDSFAHGAYGRALAGDDTRLLAGDYRWYDDFDTTYLAGAVYVYGRGASGWGLQQQLVASDLAINHEFGRAVALSGNTIAVGAREFHGPGAVYVFDFDGVTWHESQKLKVSDDGLTRYFGTALALTQQRLIAGAPIERGTFSKEGKVHMYRRGAGGLWESASVITPSAPVEKGYFGATLALDGDVLVVGAPAPNVPTPDGKVFVYELGETTWQERALLTPPEPSLNEGFGVKVAIEGDLLLVSGCKARPDAYYFPQVFFYRHSSGGWQLDQTITYPETISSSCGPAVQLRERRAYVGFQPVTAPDAQSQTEQLPGLVRVYSFDEGSGGVGGQGGAAGTSGGKPNPGSGGSGTGGTAVPPGYGCDCHMASRRNSTSAVLLTLGLLVAGGRRRAAV